MSLNDGKMVNKELYSTSDKALAAYLLTRGFELLGAIDTGNVSKTGRPRLDFGITSTDPEILSNMLVYIEQAGDEFENTYFAIPHAPEVKVNFKTYYQSLNKLHRSLDNPIRKDS